VELVVALPGRLAAGQADVGELVAGAGVGAAVDVQPDLAVEVGERLLQLPDQLDGRLLGRHQGQLAEGQAGAGHRPPVELAGEGGQVEHVQPGHRLLDPLVGHVQHHELLLGGEPDPAAAQLAGQLGHRDQGVAVGPPDQRRDPDVVGAVALAVDADVVAVGVRRRRRLRAVLQRPAQVVALHHLAEALRPPGGEQELDPGPGPLVAVAVVAVGGGDGGHHLGRLGPGDEHPQAVGEPRAGGQAAADQQVEALAAVGVDMADQGQVVDLGLGAAVAAARDRHLVLAGEVGELLGPGHAGLDRQQVRGGVEPLAGVDPGHRAAEQVADGVPAGLEAAQADPVQLVEDGGHVLDHDPVELDVLAVGDVGQVAAVAPGQLADGGQLVAGERAARDADAQHEVAVLGRALGVQPPPAEPDGEVVGVDGGQPLAGVAVDAGPQVERVQGLLDLLVAVASVLSSHRWSPRCGR
jgi:hypothetical protein